MSTSRGTPVSGMSLQSHTVSAEFGQVPVAGRHFKNRDPQSEQVISIWMVLVPPSPFVLLPNVGRCKSRRFLRVGSSSQYEITLILGVKSSKWTMFESSPPRVIWRLPLVPTHMTVISSYRPCFAPCSHFCTKVVLGPFAIDAFNCWEMTSVLFWAGVTVTAYTFILWISSDNGPFCTLPKFRPIKLTMRWSAFVGWS